MSLIPTEQIRAIIESRVDDLPLPLIVRLLAEEVLEYREQAVAWRAMQIHGHEVTNDPEGVLGWLKAHHPTLLNLLLLTDEFWSGIVFQDETTHTISWHIAMMAKHGNVVAMMACEALELLSKNHCANALAGGV